MILLHEIKAEASRREVPPTIFVERFWKISQRLERGAIEDGYVIGGLMEILSKEARTGSDSLSKDLNIDVVETKDVRFGMKYSCAHIQSIQSGNPN